MKPNKLSSRQIIIAVLVVIILLLTGIAYSKTDERQLNPVEKLLKDSVTAIQRVVYSPFIFVSNTFTSYGEMLSLYDEYKSLKHEFNKSEYIFSRNQELEKELAELKETLELNELMTDYEVLNAAVVTRNVDGWNNVLTIDKGSFQGVEKDMAVINNQGLVGRITNVSQFTSEVKLITSHDLQNKISITIHNGDKSTYGLINGYDVSENLLNAEGIASNEKINSDSSVLTSGLGGIFPKGILVGKVVDAVKDSVDLTQIVKVEPAVDFTDLRYITIVKRKALD